jgi:hypothetical protein
MEGRGLQHRPNLPDQCLVRAGAEGAGTSARSLGRLSLPIDSRPRHTPHTTDPSQAIADTGGGRSGPTRQLDLRRLKGRPVSTRASFSRNSSLSMVDSPSFSRRRAISRSRASRGCCVISSRPPNRKASLHAARRAAGTLSSRDSRSIASPRRSRHTTSVFFWAENRSGRAPLCAVSSLVALHVPAAEAGGIPPSCVSIWTPPQSTIAYSVSNETVPQWTRY